MTAIPEMMAKVPAMIIRIVMIDSRTGRRRTYVFDMLTSLGSR